VAPHGMDELNRRRQVKGSGGGKREWVRGPREGYGSPLKKSDKHESENKKNTEEEKHIRIEIFLQGGKREGRELAKSPLLVPTKSKLTGRKTSGCQKGR